MKIRHVVELTGLFLVMLMLFGCQTNQLSSTQPGPETGIAVETSGFNLSASLATDGAGSGGGAYTSKVSVRPGETLNFHISNGRSGPYEVKIYREGAAHVLVDTVTDVRTSNYGCANGYATGCNWPVAFTYRIPSSWKSGVYTAEIPLNSGKSTKAIFWVKETNPGSRSKVLFLSSVDTYQAYNTYSGGSLYPFKGIQYTQVSFDRPYENALGLFSRWEQYFVSWAEKEGYTMEYATTYDLAFEPDLLSHYDVAIIAGHSEYWSWDMRDQVKTFINHGGRFMNLAGNVMWWQVRFEDNGRTMIGYKNWRKDPQSAPKLTTDYPWNYPIFDNPFTIIGLDYRFGGFPGKKGDSYTAVNTSHWIYAGTNIHESQEFGKGSTADTSIHDKESDGMPLNCATDGYTLLGAPGRNMSPANFTILGITPVLSKQRKVNSFAEMGIYTLPGGGALFSAGATGWVLALGQPNVAQMTRNIMDKFISGNFPQEPNNPDSQYLFYDRFNCNNLGHLQFTAKEIKDIVRHNYIETAGTERDKFSTTCGVDGSGLEIATSVPKKGHRYTNPIYVNWGGTNKLYTRVYLDLQKLKMSNGATFNLIEQYNDDRISKLQPATELQISSQGNGLAVRYQPRGANLPWITIPSQRGFWLETEWDKATGKISVWVDGTLTSQTVAMNSQPALNRFDFGALSKSGNVSGTFCMDELAYNDASRR